MHMRLHLARGSGSTAALLGVVLLLLVGGSGSPAYADAPAPQLSIAVDDGGASAKAGDRLGYTITVTNLGATKVKDVRVSQTVPPGASVASADAGGDEVKGKISWLVDLAPASKATMHTTMTLGTTPESTLRVATVACAQVSVKGPALVCAADSDQLPAGAAAEAARPDAAASSSGWLDGRTPWYVGGGAALVLVLLGALLLVRSRRKLGARVGA